MHVSSRQQYLPQTPSALDVCLHKDDPEQGNRTIFHQYLPCRTFSDFYYHHLCLAQMRHLDVSSSATQGMTGNEKKPTSIRNHVLHGHGKKFTRFLSFLDLQKNSHLDGTSEISTDDVSIKQRKADEVSVGVRL